MLPHQRLEGSIIPLADKAVQQFGIGSRAAVVEPGLPQKADKGRKGSGCHRDHSWNGSSIYLYTSPRRAFSCMIFSRQEKFAKVRGRDGSEKVVDPGANGGHAGVIPGSCHTHSLATRFSASPASSVSHVFGLPSASTFRTARASGVPMFSNTSATRTPRHQLAAEVVPSPEFVCSRSCISRCAASGQSCFRNACVNRHQNLSHFRRQK